MVEKVLNEKRLEALVQLAALKDDKLAELNLAGLGIDKMTNLVLAKYAGELRKLHLQDNQLTNLPKRLMVSKEEEKENGASSKLTYLDLSSNLLTLEGAKRMTKWRLSSLVTLKLANNKLEEFPTSLWKQIPQLRALVLNNNELTSISFPVKMEHLNTLILSRNRLTDLSSPEIGLQKLVGLKKLSVTDNELMAVPYIDECTLLAELRLAGNKISKFQNERYKDLFKLTMIDLSRNEIQSMHDMSSLAILKHLSNVAYANNPFLESEFSGDRKKAGEAIYAAFLQANCPRMKILDSKPMTYYNFTAGGEASDDHQGQKNISKTSQKRPGYSKTGEAQETEKKKPKLDKDDNESETELVQKKQQPAGSGVQEQIEIVVKKTKNKKKKKEQSNNTEEATAEDHNEEEEQTEPEQPKTWQTKPKIDTW